MTEVRNAARNAGRDAALTRQCPASRAGGFALTHRKQCVFSRGRRPFTYVISKCMH